MSVYRTSLLAFASLLPIALAMPAAAANQNVISSSTIDTSAKTSRDIGGHPVVLDRCDWYNFHQSISLWPVYKDCTTRKAEYWKKSHIVNGSYGFSKNAVALMKRQAKNHSDVYTKPSELIQLEIDKHYNKTPCAWFNYFHSRIRTPLYLKCENKSNQASYGMYSEPDFLKSFTTPGTIEQERTHDQNASKKPAPVILSSTKFNEKITKKLGGQKITLTRCEWSNFFQSISFLPRYLACNVATNGDQLRNYEGNKNLNKITFKFGADGSSQDGAEFKKFLVLTVGLKDVTATVCEWYNLVQSEYRWPIYRACPTDTSKKAKYTVKTVNGPGPDRLVRHELLYSN
jgi:hypothetical protein